MAAINPMYQWLGIEVVIAATDVSCFSMPVKREHANTFGVCHGGIVFAFADLAMGFTCNARGERSVTASASIEFLKPVPLGERLLATVRETAVSGRNIHYSVWLNLEGTPDEDAGLLHGRMRVVGGELPR